MRGHADVVAALLRAGADPTVAARDGWTALHAAAREGRGDIARALLRAGADGNARTLLGRTPATVAAAFGQVDVLRRLLRAGSEPDWSLARRGDAEDDLLRMLDATVTRRRERVRDGIAYLKTLGSAPGWRASVAEPRYVRRADASLMNRGGAEAATTPRPRRG